jgi:hypothetical protein
MVQQVHDYKDLRFMSKQNLVHTQRIMGEQFRDIIHNYGIDVIYFRRFIDNELSSYTGNLSSDIEHVYGDETTDTFWLSAPMVIYLDIQGDSYLLSKFGIQTDADGQCFFTVEDFNEQFADTVGEQVTGELSGNFITPMLSCYDNAAEPLNKYYSSGNISAVIGNADISGIVEQKITERMHNFIYTNNYYNPINLINETVNPDIIEPNYYDYERTITNPPSGWYCHYRGHTDDNWEGSASGYITGQYIYNTKFLEKNHPKDPITPQVGDFFRLKDFQEDNPEEYEVTQITDRNLMADGISPLLGTYMWQMDVVRREPSYEDVLSGQGIQEEPDIESQLEQNKWSSNIGNEIFNYDKESVDEVDPADSDSVYGDYGLPKILQKGETISNVYGEEE